VRSLSPLGERVGVRGLPADQSCSADPTSRELDLILDYHPRRQFVPFHDRSERFACIVTHRCAGKTVASIEGLQRGALECTLVRPRFAYMSPFLKQSKAVAWDYLRAAMAPLREHGATVHRERAARRLSRRRARVATASSSSGGARRPIPPGSP
jgi:hypothetical protein